MFSVRLAVSAVAVALAVAPAAAGASMPFRPTPQPTSAILAEAEATFGIDYTRSSTHTSAWSYSTTIPAGKAGLVAVLHRADRMVYTKYATQPNCSTTEQHSCATLPLQDTNVNSDYCYIRDLEPYSSMSRRASCKGE